jgi:hypothetical protein
MLFPFSPSFSFFCTLLLPCHLVLQSNCQAKSLLFFFLWPICVPSRSTLLSTSACFHLCSFSAPSTTLSVLLFTRHLIENNSRGPSTFFQACVSIFLAIVSLSFRQTNIFWVGVFPIALLALGALHTNVESIRPGDGKSVVLKAWNNATFYDPQVRDSILNGQSTRLFLSWLSISDSTQTSGLLAFLL